MWAVVLHKAEAEGEEIYKTQECKPHNLYTVIAILAPLCIQYHHCFFILLMDIYKFSILNFIGMTATLMSKDSFPENI